MTTKLPVAVKEAAAATVALAAVSATPATVTGKPVRAAAGAPAMYRLDRALKKKDSAVAVLAIRELRKKIDYPYLSVRGRRLVTVLDCLRVHLLHRRITRSRIRIPQGGLWHKDEYLKAVIQAIDRVLKDLETMRSACRRCVRQLRTTWKIGDMRLFGLYLPAYRSRVTELDGRIAAIRAYRAQLEGYRTRLASMAKDDPWKIEYHRRVGHHVRYLIGWAKASRVSIPTDWKRIRRLYGVVDPPPAPRWTLGVRWPMLVTGIPAAVCLTGGFIFWAGLRFPEGGAGGAGCAISLGGATLAMLSWWKPSLAFNVMGTVATVLTAAGGTLLVTLSKKSWPQVMGWGLLVGVPFQVAAVAVGWASYSNHEGDLSRRRRFLQMELDGKRFRVRFVPYAWAAEQSAGVGFVGSF